MLALLLSLAHASGVLGFSVTPDAQVVLAPRTGPTTIELAIYDNRVPIREQLEGITTDHLVDADAVSIGGGTTFLTLQVDRPEIVVVPTVDRGRVTLTLDVGNPDPPGPIPTPTLESIIENMERARPAPPRPMPLIPLVGHAAAGLPEARTLELGPSTDKNMDWQTVDFHRRKMLESTEPDQVAEHRLALAKGYLALDHAREASVYALKLREDHPGIPTEEVELLVANAASASGNWEQAREHCVLAHEAGASETDVLFCLGRVALGSATPSPTAVGLALEDRVKTPEAILLAGFLLAMDNRFGKARSLLEDAPAGISPVYEAQIQLTLGDARYMTGDSAGAAEAWGAIQKSSELHKLAHFRTRMSKLAASNRREWATAIPELTTETRSSGRVGIEAMYILAQIAHSQGDVRGSTKILNTLWRQHRELSLKADVPERLVAMCRQRLEQLNRMGRGVDEVATFEECWREDLDLLAPDPDSLERVATLYFELGLRKLGLAVQHRALTVHTASGDDDANALLTLAEMYTQTGHYTEALETVDYLDRNAPSPGARRLIAVGDARTGLEEWSKAEQAYRGAMALEPKNTLAKHRLGLLLARLGQCSEALRLLSEDAVLETELIRTRCLLDRGEDQDAIAAAKLALEAATDPDSREQASWLLGVALTRSGAELPEGVELPEPWASMVREEQALEELFSKSEE